MKSVNIKWIVVIALTVVLWNWASSIALMFLATHHMQTVSPLLYLSSWINLPATSSTYHLLINAGTISTLLLCAAIVLIIKPAIPDIYGKARFASFFDIKKSGLLENDGVVLGRAYNRFLRLSGYEHVTVFAPTGTGKTTGITVPNLFEWNESCVVSDIKLELFRLTSKYRQEKGHQIYLWSIGNPDGLTHCFNPLDIIGDHPHTRVDEIQKIAAIFIPDNASGESIWEPQARMLFVALTLYVLDTPHIPKTISSVVKLFKSQPNFVGFLEETLETRDDLDPVCREIFMKLAEISEKTRSSVTFTFTSRFELFDNPMIIAATAHSDFDIRELRRKKMTIYVGVTNDNLVRLSPLLTVFYQQVADVMTRKIPAEDEPYGVLFLMDEFSALRRMESFQKNIGLYREYRLRIIIIIQEVSQLYDIYGRDGSKVFINSKVRIAFTQNDDETCRLLETMLGNKTIIINQRSKNMSTSLYGSGGRSESINYASRPLMLAQEIRMMPETKALIFVQGVLPIYANKIAWYKLSQYKENMKGAVVVPSILLSIKKIMDDHRNHTIKKASVLQQPTTSLDDGLLDNTL